MQISKFPKKTGTRNYRSQTPIRAACRAQPACPGIPVGRGRRPGGGPERPGALSLPPPGAGGKRSHQPLGGAWQERNGTSAERGEPLAWDLQRQKVCNLAAAFHTPCPSCLRTVRPQSRTPRAPRAKCLTRGPEDAARRGGRGSVPSSGPQRAPAVWKAAAAERRKGSPTLPSARLGTCRLLVQCAGHTRATFNKRKRRPRLAPRR